MILVIDKPKGLSSFDVIRKLRKITGIKKMGHTGTLDPFATGILLICLQKYTRVIPLFENDTKQYNAAVMLGTETSTHDPEGEVVCQKPVPEINAEMLLDAKAEMLSLNSQIPPSFSAIKVNGQRAYKLAREGKKVELKPRPITIYEFEINSLVGDVINYTTTVSKGTYIRSLSVTLANYFGTVGTTVALRRTKVGGIDISKAVSLNDITPENYQNYILCLEDVLPDFPSITLNKENSQDFAFGKRIPCIYDDINKIMIKNNLGKCIGFGFIKSKVLHPKTVLI